jgi:hypothetical protein
MSTNLKCTHCGTNGLVKGFLSGTDTVYERWVEGPLKIGITGGAKLWGRKKSPVTAYRCRQCDHLELFAGDDE